MSPAISARQYRAMQAAKHGNSTLGIPKSVGAEFVAATDAPSELPESKADEEMERCKEKHAHHTKMCRKAPTPASRALHRKLRDHYAKKIGT